MIIEDKSSVILDCTRLQQIKLQVKLIKEFGTKKRVKRELTNLRRRNRFKNVVAATVEAATDRWSALMIHLFGGRM